MLSASPKRKRGRDTLSFLSLSPALPLLFFLPLPLHGGALSSRQPLKKEGDKRESEKLPANKHYYQKYAVIY